LAGTLNPQLNPSALRPGLSAAKAALEMPMQHSRSAAAAISINHLVAKPSLSRRDPSLISGLSAPL